MSSFFLDTDGWEVASHAHITMKEALSAAALKFTAWHIASLPCDILTHLYASGLISNPVIERNDLACRWVEDSDWALRKAFRVPEDFAKEDSEIVMRFLDLDCGAEIFLNGKSVGNANNQFREHTFDITDALQTGENSLLIYFRSAKKVAEVLEQIHGVLPSGFDTARVHNRRCQCLTGWDWAARLSSPSLMTAPEIIAEAPLSLNAPFAFARELPAVELGSDLAPHALINIEADVRTRRKASGVLTAEITTDDPTAKLGTVQTAVQLKAGSNRVRIPMRIENAPLWWPLAMGPQNLLKVRLSVSATDRTGTPLSDSVEIRFGVRTAAIQRAKDDIGESFVPLINGHPVFCRGANWIPISMLPAQRTEAQCRELIAASAAAGMNCLRVWGGGIYEPKLFYDLCDASGILVWQDFMYACAAYPTYREFADEAEKEASFQIARLRNHPSIFLWCGNNENEWLHQIGDLRKGKESKIIGEPLWSGLIRRATEDLDPSRPYHQSSPYGRDKQDFNSMSSGDRHNWECWARWQSPDAYLADTGRFISEFGFQSFPSRESIAEFAPLAASADDPVLLHHQKMILGQERLARYMMELLGLPQSLDQWIDGTQMLQAEILRRAVEHWRRRKFRTAGALIWQLHDAYPAISWSLIGYDRRPKLAYDASKRFFAPVLVSIGLRVNGTERGAIPVELWAAGDNPDRLAACDAYAVLINDTCYPLTGSLQIRAYRGDRAEEISRHDVPVVADRNSISSELPIELPFDADTIRSQWIEAEFIPDDASGEALKQLADSADLICTSAIGAAVAREFASQFSPRWQSGLRAQFIAVEPKYFSWPDGVIVNSMTKPGWIGA